MSGNAVAARSAYHPISPSTGTILRLIVRGDLAIGGRELQLADRRLEYDDDDQHMQTDGSVRQAPAAETVGQTEVTRRETHASSP